MTKSIATRVFCWWSVVAFLGTVTTTRADANGSWDITLENLAGGSYSLRAKALDSVGNESGFSNAVQVTVDRSAPNINPLTLPATSGRQVTLNWSSNETNVQYTLQVSDTNSLAWTTWLTTPATGATFNGLPGETYAFRLQAVDSLGNQSDWTAPATTTIAAVTKYYSFGGQKVAMRRGDEVYYLSGDHLGSTSLTTDETGAVVSEARYLPYGQERWANGSSVTDFGFTSQRNEASFGLMDYNARYYSPTLGRFVSPDSIVPEPGSSGGFNRYRYTRNNPLKYADPTGHCIYYSCEDVIYATVTSYASVVSTETLVNTAQAAHQLNNDTSVVFSNAPLEERFMPATRVGVFAVMTADSAIGVTALAKAGYQVTKLGGKQLLKHLDDAAKGIDNFADDLVGAACSFSPDTVVATETGLTPISEVNVDGYVLAFNEETEEVGYYPVTSVWAHEDSAIVHLNIDGELIETTPEHPFYTIDGKWIAAADLQPDARIRKADGSYGIVDSVEIDEQPQWMYNFTVDEAHTYFVGQGQWLVHNSCFTFPDTKGLAKRLEIKPKQIHEVKKGILKDEEIAPLLKKLGADNPDIGWDDVGNIVLKNRKSGKTIETDVPLDWFKME